MSLLARTHQEAPVEQLQRRLHAEHGFPRRQLRVLRTLCTAPRYLIFGPRKVLDPCLRVSTLRNLSFEQAQHLRGLRMRSRTVWSSGLASDMQLLRYSQRGTHCHYGLIQLGHVEERHHERQSDQDDLPRRHRKLNT